MKNFDQKHIRNIAIIAHVDHGKTTLVDAMLKQTHSFAAHEQLNDQTTIMDSGELERERGVTILAKNTAVFWHDYKVNILDTPGHADFSGEVERVLNMADGCVLLVDAAEGVLSQTKYVLGLALQLKLRPLVIINKVDRKDQRTEEVEHEIADLFLEQAVTDDQLEFPVLYARGIEGIVGTKVEENPDHSMNITDSTDLEPFFKTIIEQFPAPGGDPEKPLQLQVNSLDWDSHKGKIIIGRIFNGTINQGQRIVILEADGKSREATVSYLFTHVGLHRVETSQAKAGDIVALAGVNGPHIGDTLADRLQPVALPRPNISEPTVKIQMSVNSSPFAGKEAQFSTSRQVRDRLTKELETNVGLRIEAQENGEKVTIVGRGELHLAILIETMRREGYEFSLSRPEVVHKEIDGRTHEPWEEVIIDAPEEYTGVVTSGLGQRGGLLQNMQTTKNGVRFSYQIATANLIGYRNELLTNTSGAGVLNSGFLEYRPLGEEPVFNRGGAIIAHEPGTVTAYALDKAQQRATMLVEPGDMVYSGQVVGINMRAEDMVFNVTKGKKLTNMRAASADATISLAPSWKPSLEQFLTTIAPDEMLEVTPQSLRLRKKQLKQK
jgi:GTP-binding protein